MVEALVAITVLTIGVVGTLSVLSQSLINADYAKNQITAFFLAQEGQELVIGKRNNNRLTGFTDGEPGNDQYWLSGLTVCAEACYIGTADEGNVNSKEFSQCESGGVCQVINLNDNGFYGYQFETGGAGSPTIFRREIQVTPFTVTEETIERGATVRSTVIWNDRPGGEQREFTINSIIYR